jgi:serine/threonine protein kinase
MPRAPECRFGARFASSSGKVGRVGIELSQGDQVGMYRVGGLLGTGATAVVYRATGPDGVEVALKLVRPELSAEENFRHRFELEISIAQRVTHPNVVAVLDSGEHEGDPWLTQELVTGGSLGDVLTERSALPMPEALALIEDAAAGLDAVHAAGLVHRDVKPANILLDDDGTALITDFGFARDTDSDRRYTRPGETLGSMNYMAPEQIEAADVGPYTDVYALGCVLFELVAGITPFGDKPGMGVMMAHLDADPPHPSDKQPGIPREVGDAILTALAKDPAARPPSASAYAEAVRAAAGRPSPQAS